MLALFHTSTGGEHLVKQTLLMLLECRRGGGGEDDYAKVIANGIPREGELQRRYFGQIGEFIACALDGWVRGPEEY